jgi:hypothetical protein
MLDRRMFCATLGAVLVPRLPRLSVSDLNPVVYVDHNGRKWSRYPSLREEFRKELHHELKKHRVSPIKRLRYALSTSDSSPRMAAHYFCMSGVVNGRDRWWADAWGTGRHLQFSGGLFRYFFVLMVNRGPDEFSDILAPLAREDAY